MASRVSIAQFLVAGSSMLHRTILQEISEQSSTGCPPIDCHQGQPAPQAVFASGWLSHRVLVRSLATRQRVSLPAEIVHHFPNLVRGSSRADPPNHLTMDCHLIRRLCLPSPRLWSPSCSGRKPFGPEWLQPMLRIRCRLDVGRDDNRRAAIDVLLTGMLARQLLFLKWVVKTNRSGCRVVQCAWFKLEPTCGSARPLFSNVAENLGYGWHECALFAMYLAGQMQ